MKHVLYRIEGADKAPQGDGDARSWFYFYKFHPGEDEAACVPNDRGLQVAAGDILWFAVDAHLIGAVPVDRVEEDPMNARQEIWYMGDQIVTVMDLKVPSDMEAEELSEYLGKVWDRRLKGRREGPQP